MPQPASLPFGSRVMFAWIAFFRILFDGAFAARLFSVRDQLPEPKKAANEVVDEDEPPVPVSGVKSTPTTHDTAAVATTGALQLLALLQREGRLVDFLEQDVATFADADVGAAARVVHEGARKALRALAHVAPIRGEDEGAKVSIEKGEPGVKLTGNVAGSAPYRGVLRHRGWRVTDVKLPTPAPGHDPSIVAPAEVEL